MAKSRKVVIVDDESKARKMLQLKIEEHFPDLEITKSASGADEAMEFLSENQTDILFLDISMPKKSGLDMLKEMPEKDFAVIFITSYDSYAIEAIKFSAQGYILKPIDDKELVETVNRTLMNLKRRNNRKMNHATLKNLSLENNSQKLFGIPSQEGLEFIKIGDIIHCEGWQKYTKVHTQDGNIIVSSYNIGEFNNHLETKGFYLVHRSHLINLQRIKKYLKEGTIIMTNDNRVPVARRKRSQFLEKITRI